jgi:hypothetical protein
MARWVRDNREATKAEVREVFSEGLNKAAETLLGDANLTVPHDEGILESSGIVQPGDMEAAVGYNTPYAVRQHEEVEYVHPGKGRHHWLERTLAERADVYQGIVRDHIDQRLR